MDTPSKTLRRGLAQALSSVLLSVAAESAPTDMFDTKAGNKGSIYVMNDAFTGERSSAVAGKSTHPTVFKLELHDMLRQLSQAYIRSSHRLIRAGLVLTYAQIFKSAGSKIVDANYQIILRHLLSDLIAGVSQTESRYRSLSARKHVQFILCDVVRRQLLSEPAKTRALHTILEYLENPDSTKSSEPGHEQVMEPTISALCELSGILQDMGSATPTSQVSRSLFRV
jgi:hypothetical protein